MPIQHFEIASGLCNRLQTLASILISEECKLHKLYWPVWPAGCNAAFNQLFENDYGILDIAEMPSDLPHYEIQEFHQLIDFPESRRIKVYYCVAFSDTRPIVSTFEWNRRMHKQLNEFRPTYTAKSIIDKFADEASQCYGIHIRRGSGMHFNVPACNMSPTTLYEKKIESILAEEKDAKFFVVSDSAMEIHNLVNKYGDSIKYSTELYPVWLDSGYSTLGMEKAVSDFFLLSKTKEIFGSFYSSFSQLAGIMGNKKVTLITEPESCNYYPF